MLSSLLVSFTTDFMNTAFGFREADGKDAIKSPFSGNANSPEQQKLGNEPEL